MYCLHIDGGWARGSVAVLAAVVVTVVAGCASNERATAERFSGSTARRAAIATAWRSDEALSAADEARILDNCGPLGAPQLNRHVVPLIGPTVQVCRDGYVLLHSSVDKIPLWVCEHIEPSELRGNAVRRDRFAPDPLLANGSRAELQDYRGSGYDRGHMAPAGNQASVQKRKDETFYLSNMIPQEPRFNQSAWAGLEDLIRTWGEQGELYTVTGALFWDPSEEDPATADGVIDYWVIGPHRVAVPTHAYKIVLRREGADAWQCVAFVMENVNDYAPPYDYSSYIVSVQDIERRTGINFFPALPAGAAAIESTEGRLFE